MSVDNLASEFRNAMLPAQFSVANMEQLVGSGFDINQPISQQEGQITLLEFAVLSGHQNAIAALKKLSYDFQGQLPGAVSFLLTATLMSKPGANARLQFVTQALVNVYGKVSMVKQVQENAKNPVSLKRVLGLLASTNDCLVSSKFANQI